MARIGPGLVAVASIAVLLAACAHPAGPVRQTARGDDAITVASFDFTESTVLAQVYGQVLEARGFSVKWALGIGPRELVDPALQLHLVEFVPEYGGSALDFLTRAQRATSNPKTTHARLATSFAKRGIWVLDAAKAQDSNAFAVTEATARRYDLHSISDLAPVASRLVLGGPPECPSRPLCLQGLESTYGLKFRRFLHLDASGALTHAALSGGDVDVALVFTTDPAVRERGFVLLRDDRGLEPAENVTPVISRELVLRYGDRLIRSVDAVSARLDTAGLLALNQAVAEGKGSPRTVARQWISSHGLGS
jgi:osmoprotectant transport system substrate-binding protein